MRRVLALVPVLAIAIALVFVLRARKRAFIAVQVELLQADDRGEATEARKRLQRIGRSAVRPVCGVLEHRDPGVRARAALTLANIGDAAACGPLMEAAKRGDLPAARALEFLEHPRVKEAYAWAYRGIGEGYASHLEAHLPVGGMPPDELWRAHYLDKWAYKLHNLDDPRDLVRRHMPKGEELEELRWDPRLADEWYGDALYQFALPEAWLGKARIHELCGRYERGAELYGRVLQLRAEDEEARAGEERCEELARLVERMRGLLPEGWWVHRVFSDASWGDGDVSYHVAATSRRYEGLTVVYLGRVGLAVFRSDAKGLRRVGAQRASDGDGIVRDPGMYLSPGYSHVGLVRPRREQAAVVKAWSSRSRWLSGDEVRVYHLEEGTLSQVLHLVSRGAPSVTDLDGDGDAEILVWKRTQQHMNGVPKVMALVDGRYEDCTGEYAGMLGEVMRAREGR